MIVVVPKGGLCNRMRVVDSCISLQNQRTGKPVIKMLWEKDHLLNCSFEDLFQPIKYIESVLSHPYINHYKHYVNNNSLPLRSRIKRKLYSRILQSYQKFDDDNIIDFIYKREYWQSVRKKLIISSCIDFYSPELLNAHLFLPVEELQVRIEEQMGKFSGPCVGIHVRRTDNAKSKSKSTTSLFFKEIEKILATNRNYKFFLSTDDADEERLFKKRFGNIIFTQPKKELSRNSKNGIKDALVDLYCLSRTDFIIGSYWSAFTRVAAAINNKPFTIVGE